MLRSTSSPGIPVTESQKQIHWNLLLTLCYRENQVYSERSRISHCSCIDKMTCVVLLKQEDSLHSDGNYMLR